MEKPTGETVALPTLGPLPDLDAVVFVRNKNRDFVLGRGPMATDAPAGARRFMRIGAWVLFAAGILVCLAVGVMELRERQQYAAMVAILKTVDAEVVGCDSGSPPRFRFTADGQVVEKYARERPADMCTRKQWQVSYIPGSPQYWSVAPDVPFGPFEDRIDAIWIVVGPTLLVLAVIYRGFLALQNRRAGQEARLAKQGKLIGGEVTSMKWYSGGDGDSPSLRVGFRVSLPDGRVVESKQSFSNFDLDRRALPPEGSKLLVLRIDDGLQQVL